MAFTQQPTDVVAADAIAPAVVVQVLDADSLPVSGVDVTVGLSGGDAGASLGGTATEATATDGTATFADLTVDKVGTGYILTASATGPADLPSDPFAVSAGSLATIAVSPDGATITAGGTQAYTAEGFDAKGNDLGDVTGATTFSIESGAGGSCTSATCTAAVVGDWTVTGDDGGISDAVTLHVSAGALDHIAVSPDDATIMAGGTQDYTAEGFDAEGNDLGDVTGATTFSIESGAGGSCTSATCTATLVGAWAVTGTYQGGGPTASSTLHVQPGTPTKLAFDQQPVNTPVGVRLPNVTVEVQDAFGNVVTAPQSGNKIALAIAHNPSGGHMSGGDAHSIVDGVATFHDLVFDKPGTAYTIRATPTISGLTPSLSQPFNIKGPTKVTTSASKHLIAYEQPVGLVAHLSACLDGCVLTIYRLPAGGTQSVVGLPNRPVNARNNVVVTVHPGVDTTYWAVFSGDSRYLRFTSNKVVVNVHVLVGSALHGYFAAKDGYRLFHYYSACPQKHLGCPELQGWVTPDKTDKRLYFTLQAHVSGRWQTISTTVTTMHACPLKPVACASIVWIYGGPSVKNIPLRTRARFAGDAYNEGFNGEWRYFKVV
jgi:hypothetical protein